MKFVVGIMLTAVGIFWAARRSARPGVPAPAVANDQHAQSCTGLLWSRDAYRRARWYARRLRELIR